MPKQISELELNGHIRNHANRMLRPELMGIIEETRLPPVITAMVDAYLPAWQETEWHGAPEIAFTKQKRQLSAVAAVRITAGIRKGIEERRFK